MPQTSLVSVQLIGASRVERALLKLADKSPKIVAQAMFTAGMAYLRPNAKTLIRNQKRVFRGQLRQRTTVKATHRGMSMGMPEIHFGSKGVNYSKAIEFGTKPRKINKTEFGKIVQWAGKKMKVPKADRFAFAQQVADTIEAEGNQPHPYLMPVWVAWRRRFWRDVFKRVQLRIRLMAAKK